MTLLTLCIVQLLCNACTLAPGFITLSLQYGLNIIRFSTANVRGFVYTKLRYWQESSTKKYCSYLFAQGSPPLSDFHGRAVFTVVAGNKLFCSERLIGNNYNSSSSIEL